MGRGKHRAPGKPGIGATGNGPGCGCTTHVQEPTDEISGGKPPLNAATMIAFSALIFLSIQLYPPVCQNSVQPLRCGTGTVHDFPPETAVITARKCVALV